MNTLDGGTAVTACAALDYVQASAITNQLLWQIGRLLELVASAGELPVIGGLATALFVAIGVPCAIVAFLLSLSIMLLSSIAAAVPGAVSALPGHLVAALRHGRPILGLF